MTHTCALCSAAVQSKISLCLAWIVANQCSTWKTPEQKLQRWQNKVTAETPGERCWTAWTCGNPQKTKSKTFARFQIGLPLWHSFYELSICLLLPSHIWPIAARAFTQISFIYSPQTHTLAVLWTGLQWLMNHSQCSQLFHIISSCSIQISQHHLWFPQSKVRWALGRWWTVIPSLGAFRLPNDVPVFWTKKPLPRPIT